MKVHHIGYAVKRIEKAAETFAALGYTLGDITEDKNRKIRIMFIENGTERVELVAPNGDDTPVDGILKSTGPTPYHICYETQELKTAMDELKEKGFVTVKEPEPAPAIDGCNVAFMYNARVGLIELVEIK